MSVICVALNSDGKNRGFSYGIRESYDVAAAVDYMRKKREMEKVAVIGTSVGASSVILAAANLRSQIDCIIAENPLTHPVELLKFHLNNLITNYLPNVHRKPYFRALFFQIIRLVFLFRIGGLLDNNIGAIDVLDKIKIPILLMHGKDDDIIPVTQSMQLYEKANEPKELWLAEETWHCALFDKQPIEYRQRVIGFITKYISLKSKAQ